MLPGEAIIESLNPAATFDGQPAFELTLSSGGADMGDIEDRFVQYRAELISDAGVTLAEFRILHHTEDLLVLSPESSLLPPLKSISN